MIDSPGETTIGFKEHYNIDEDINITVLAMQNLTNYIYNITC